jgi:Uma2 family endonuclease
MEELLMQAQTRHYYTEEEYLALEREAEEKSEYFDGEIFAMSGGTGAHSLIASGVITALSNQLRGGSCRVYNSDMRIAIQSIGKYTYPDVAVVCGQSIYRDESNDTLVNPVLIVEVLSPSTEAYDRGEKFRPYRAIESLGEYVLVSQGEPRIESYARHNDHWVLTEAAGLDATITLNSIGCVVPLADVYAQIDWTGTE